MLRDKFYYLSFFIFLISPGLAAQSIDPQDLQDIKKILAVQQARIDQLQSKQISVGSIVQSILGEAEFARLNGSGWVLMKGQSIEGSVLCKQTSLCKLPDASGRFLRSAGGPAAPLRSAQDQGTAVNQLKVVDFTGIKSFQGSTDGVSIKRWEDTVVTGPGVIDRGPTYPGTRFGVTVSGDINHGHLLTGDVETRPMNLTVNTFVKIN
jgi:hypothetical protein